ncbi:MAG: folylpolyglutamate synthase/dihydrofolate synthase family protein [Candidatus Marinimicrobia bacterium]|jgi:dihydrofolate synthase/folylpolyglutamate synthase|nr:folylpolyglutamate synthase/dihydrofolate synthase family protein [Candidatus Neomarinimicrobiota bacterium]MDP7037030.1 folylpolyglutamate synthase/dihydrofolate synthase family protein [Candidatus Neomarinimicrobiota bacterium]|tara:strand:+ start:824 stop:2092 length:1269 start_codon:yes stop_codon:yes gene_type:complete
MYSQSTSVEFNSLLDYLYKLQRLGIKVGLNHTFELLQRCGNPQNQFQSIHIAGTNGKGSTSAIISSILMEAGLKVGLYTSPHLIRFNERIRVNGKPISDSKIVEFVDEHRSDIDDIESTFFETTTAMAFRYFANKNVDIAVVETGLGGRLDSTNVLTPDLTVITPISLDHRDILGKNILDISKEKAGIIKNNIPLVLAPQDNAVSSQLLKIAGNLDSDIAIVDPPTKVTLSKSGTAFIKNGLSFKTPMIGRHQAINNSVAIEAVQIFMPEIQKEVIDIGIQKVKWPGRLQRISIEKPIYYDVSHNAHGIQMTLQALHDIFGQKPIGLMVMKGDKEVDLVAAALKNQFVQLIISGDTDLGLLSAVDLSDKLSSQGLANSTRINRFEDALHHIAGIMGKDSPPTLIFGSHYVAEAVFNKFGFLF